MIKLYFPFSEKKWSVRMKKSSRRKKHKEPPDDDPPKGPQAVGTVKGPQEGTTEERPEAAKEVEMEGTPSFQGSASGNLPAGEPLGDLPLTGEPLGDLPANTGEPLGDLPADTGEPLGDLPAKGELFEALPAEVASSAASTDGEAEVSAGDLADQVSSSLSVSGPSGTPVSVGSESLTSPLLRDMRDLAMRDQAAQDVVMDESGSDSAERVEAQAPATSVEPEETPSPHSESYLLTTASPMSYAGVAATITGLNEAMQPDPIPKVDHRPFWARMRDGLTSLQKKMRADQLLAEASAESSRRLAEARRLVEEKNRRAAELEASVEDERLKVRFGPEDYNRSYQRGGGFWRGRGRGRGGPRGGRPPVEDRADAMLKKRQRDLRREECRRQWNQTRDLYKAMRMEEVDLSRDSRYKTTGLANPSQVANMNLDPENNLFRPGEIRLAKGQQPPPDLFIEPGMEGPRECAAFWSALHNQRQTVTLSICLLDRTLFEGVSERADEELIYARLAFSAAFPRPVSFRGIMFHSFPQALVVEMLVFLGLPEFTILNLLDEKLRDIDTQCKRAKTSSAAKLLDACMKELRSEEASIFLEPTVLAQRIHAFFQSGYFLHASYRILMRALRLAGDHQKWAGLSDAIYRVVNRRGSPEKFVAVYEPQEDEEDAFAAWRAIIPDSCNGYVDDEWHGLVLTQVLRTQFTRISQSRAKSRAAHRGGTKRPMSSRSPGRGNFQSRPSTSGNGSSAGSSRGSSRAPSPRGAAARSEPHEVSILWGTLADESRQWQEVEPKKARSAK